MNNGEVHKAIAGGNPLFFWLKTASGEQFLIPFLCQRCGKCCGLVTGNPCEHLEPPNICTIYETRPEGCRTFPTTGFGAIQIGCPGFKLSQKAWTKLNPGSSLIVGFASDWVFELPANIGRTAAKLERANLPKEFIDKFIELNS